MGRLPTSVLFACTRNTIRSPIAEAIMKQAFGQQVFVDSVGVGTSQQPADPFAVAVMEECGLDLDRHRAKGFDDLDVSSFDLVVTFSDEAHEKARELTRGMACEVEHWPIADASRVEGSRETRLDAFRAVREEIRARIEERFGRAADAP